MYSLACINLSSEAHINHALGSSQYPVLKVPRGSSPRSLFHDSLSFLAKQLGYITRLGHWSQELFWKKLKKFLNALLLKHAIFIYHRQ